MYRHFLIATDGSELANKAAHEGLALAAKLGAKVTVATVTEPIASLFVGEPGAIVPFREYEEAAEANAARILTQIRDAAEKLRLEVDTLHVKERFPAEGIVEAATECGCDLIVMASHGRRGLAKLFLGSQATRVLVQSSVPVLICR